MVMSISSFATFVKVLLSIEMPLEWNIIYVTAWNVLKNFVKNLKKKINTSWNARTTLSSSPTPTNKSDQSTSETTTSTSIDNIYNSDEEDGNLIYRETGSHNLPKTVEEEVIVSQSTPKKIYQPLLKGFIDKVTNTEQVNYLFSSFSLFFKSINLFLI